MKKPITIGVIGVIAIFVIGVNYAFAEFESREPVITVQMNGPSTFYLDSGNQIIRATVEIQYYTPSDGYYFMKVTHLPTQIVMRDFEVHPKDYGNGLWAVQIAYPFLESDVKFGGQTFFGEFEIHIRSEFGSQTASTKFTILESPPEESTAEESLPETTKSTSSPSPNPTTTTPSSKSVTKSTELISADSIYRKISNIIGNTDYSLGGKTTQRANDVTKTSYKIFDPDGGAFGIVNFFSVDNNIKQLEISTSHFNDDVSKILAGIVLMGLVKGVMDPQEYDTDLFTKMLGEAIIEEDSTRLIPGGHTVTVSSIEVVKGTPGLTFFIFTVDYHQSAYIVPQKDAITETSNQVPSWVKNNSKWWAEGSIDSQTFVNGIQFLIKEKIIDIDLSTVETSTSNQVVPDWVKNTAGWWANDQISEKEFIKAIEFLVENGMINVHGESSSIIEDEEARYQAELQRQREAEEARYQAELQRQREAEASTKFDPTIVESAKKNIPDMQELPKTVLKNCLAINSRSDYEEFAFVILLLKDDLLNTLEDIDAVLTTLELAGYDEHHEVGPLIKETRQIASKVVDCLTTKIARYG